MTTSSKTVVIGLNWVGDNVLALPTYRALHHRFRQDGLRSGAHIQGERPSLQQLSDQGPSPGAVAAPKSGLALDQRQLQGGGGHRLSLEEVFDGAL